MHYINYSIPVPGGSLRLECELTNRADEKTRTDILEAFRVNARNSYKTPSDTETIRRLLGMSYMAIADPLLKSLNVSFSD